MKRWTEEDLNKLRPGMIGKESSAFVHKSVKHESVDNQQKDAKNKSSYASVQNFSRAFGRLRTGEMNQTERRYSQHLELQKAAGEVIWWAFEPVNLRLGAKCFYSVDFLVLVRDGRLQAHECKGKWEDDALVKIKVAAEKFPFEFIAVRWIKGAWEYRHF